MNPVRTVCLALFGLFLAVNSSAAVELDFGIVKTLEQLSLPVPDPANPIVCHGFGCSYRTPILLRNADRVQIKKLFGAAAAKPPDGERKAVAWAMASFEKRVAQAFIVAPPRPDHPDKAGNQHGSHPSISQAGDRPWNRI